MNSLGCLLRAHAVADLLRLAREQGTREPNRAMGARQAHAIISAVLWLHGSRDDSFAAAYAASALDAALVGMDWVEARRCRDALGLHWSCPPFSAAEARALRVALGLNPDPWGDADG